MNEIETRLTELEAAYRETLARTLALDQALATDGAEDSFRRSAVTWFRRMRIDAVFPAEDSLCH